VKFVELVPVPTELVTVIRPVVAPVGTVAVICVLLLTVNVAFVPLNLTLVAPVKFVPVIVTEVPTGPLVGPRLAMLAVVVMGTSKNTSAEYGLFIADVLYARTAK